MKFGTGKVIYTVKFIPAEQIFVVRVPFLSGGVNRPKVS